MSKFVDDLTKALAGHYAIERELGRGGMATVYLAVDLKHHRKVAVKVLHPDITAALGTDRFLREIEIAAQLQHPHILPLHDSGEAGGFLYYVMPYVEGESLRSKIERESELPIPETVRILRDVVDALAEAHSHGVVHRDIKPDNVLIRGHHAVVTDFGVAKAVSEATGRQTLTTAGVALGTPTYMSPEQAAADPHTDHRSDIYAVGVMAYEMLAGRPPFTGATPQAVLAAQVTQAADPVTRHRDVPPPLAELVMRCLKKKPADRWQSADEMLTQLDAMVTPSGGITPTGTQPIPAVRASRPGRGLVVVGVMALVGGFAALFFRGSHRITPTFGATRQVTLEPGLELDPALSPDGRMVAYAAGPSGSMRIYVRTVAGGSAVDVTKNLPGNNRMPRWSPDGTQILFSSRFAVYTVPALGGGARQAVDSPAAFATWSPDGKEIAFVRTTMANAGFFASSVATALYVRSLNGGGARKVVEGREIHSPAWSPDGRLIAYVSGNAQYMYAIGVLGNLAPSTVLVVPAAGGNAVPVTDSLQLNASPTWLRDGRTLLVVSTRDGGRDIYRIPLTRGGRPNGPMERLSTGLNAGTIAVSPDGKLLAYGMFTNTANVWAIPIPQGAPVSVRAAEPVTEGNQHIEGLSISPDGKWIVFDSDRGGNADIYKMSLAGGEPIQLTTDPHDDFSPSWSRDGGWIAFHSWRNGNRDVYLTSAAGGGSEERVTDDPAHEMYPDLSPDGRRLTFYSNRTGRSEIYVVERSPSGGWGIPRQVTKEGGAASRWSPDGRTILFGHGGVALLTVETGEEHRLLASPFEQGGKRYVTGSGNWSLDGRTVYLKSVDSLGQASFLAVPTSGGTPRLLVRFDDPNRPFARVEFATDGKRLYFTIDNRQSDIWVMEVKQ